MTDKKSTNEAKKGRPAGEQKSGGANKRERKSGTGTFREGKKLNVENVRKEKDK